MPRRGLTGEGSEALAAHLTRRLGLERSETGGRAPCGIEWKETSRDGAVTIEPVYCLGNCALSPALMIDGKLRGRIHLKRFWDPRMRRELLRWQDEHHGEGLRDSVRDAIAAHRDKLLGGV